MVLPVPAGSALSTASVGARASGGRPPVRFLIADGLPARSPCHSREMLSAQFVASSFDDASSLEDNLS